MFFTEIILDNSDFYYRCKPLSLKFYSVFNKNFNQKYAQYRWVCDEEFFKYLQKFSNIERLDKRTNFSICIDSFPNEIQAYLKVNPDIVSAFKLYLNDPKLNKLYKGD